MVLPLDGEDRKAVLSTWDSTHSGVPDTDTLERLRVRAELFYTRAVDLGEPIEVSLPEAGRR